MLSDKEKELLSMYFDGELDEAQVCVVEERLSRGDAQLKSELLALCNVKRALRNWVDDGAAQMPKAGTMWRAISEKIEKEEKRVSWFEVLSDLLSPRSLGVGALACVALLVVLVGGREKSKESNRSSQSEEVASINVGYPQPDEVSQPISEMERRSAIPQVNVAQVVSVDGLSGGSKNQIGQPIQVWDLDHVSEGRLQQFKDANLDVEWLKSDRPLSLLSARSKSEPPVIWVTRR